MVPFLFGCTNYGMAINLFNVFIFYLFFIKKNLKDRLPYHNMYHQKKFGLVMVVHILYRVPGRVNNSLTQSTVTSNVREATRMIDKLCLDAFNLENTY